jgi:hypothetical protein
MLRILGWLWRIRRPANAFTVYPGGIVFETSDLRFGGDLNKAFFKAHLHAARQAANQKVASYVISRDLVERVGFSSDAIHIRTTYLYQIMQLGLASYWDYPTVSWLPLPAEEEENEKGILNTERA